MSASMAAAALGNTNGSNESEEWFDSLPEKIQNWYPDEAVEYLQTVEEIQTLIESFGCLPLNGYHEKYKLLQRVHDIPQMAILRLKEAFNHIYNENSKPLEPEHLPFQTINDDKYLANLIASADDERCKCTQVGPQSDNTRITELKCIAEVMFASGHDAECCQGSTSIRKEALQKCLLVLEVEELGSEDVLQMDCSRLNSKIKNWFRVVKIFIRFYLACEKNLTHKVLGVAGSVGQTCFIEGSKSLILQLLRFGEAVTIKNHSPEKFFPILYMFDGFVRLLPYIHALFSAEAGSFVRTKVHEVQRRLGMTVKSFLNRFMRAVKTNESSTPFTEGGVYHLTVHVMKYIQALAVADCSVTLSILLRGGGQEHSTSSSSNVNTTIKDDSEGRSVLPFRKYLEYIISTLEWNLESKSRLYTDISLKQIFLMNNISYVVLKVKDSELQTLLGERWIREQEERIQKHVTRYKIDSWSPIHFLLSSVGISDSSSGSLCMAIFKQRIQDFNLMFEEIYRTQTTWLIYDDKLRESLRTSISSKVLQEYQSFLRNLVGESHHCDRYIKYSEEDLKGFILDLFEGSPRSLHDARRLKDVLSRILIENKLPLELEKLSFELIAIEGTKVKEYIINLVHPNAIPDLKRIAEVMFASGYDVECCQTYMSSRKNALEECMLVLKVEKLSIRRVLQMDWNSLNSEIKKWVRVLNTFICVYLASEKSLADIVFGASGSVVQTGLIEASKSSILQLLSFGEAVAVRNHSPEKLCSILYMCDELMGLLPNIHVLFSNEVGSCVRTEAHELLTGLGESVTRTLNQLKNAIKTNELHTPFAGVGVHHLTSYVMKYLKDLTDYSGTLGFLLEVPGEYHLSSSSNVNRAYADDDDEWNSSHNALPVAQCFQSIISILESNLESKSLLYTDVSQQHFFLMNDICYMVEKVKDSELEPLLEESWLRKQDGKVLEHALNYERISWGPVLSLLRHEGIYNPRSGKVSKAILKERILGFNLAFEEIYCTQGMWLIQNAQLRDHVRISISSKLFLAYGSFSMKFSELGGRYLKYSVEDLVESLLDLYDGSAKPLPRSHRQTQWR